MTLKRTPLFEKHSAHNAKMVPFGGWEMPLQYAGILAEYQSTRQKTALFDTSHMGEFFIDGDLHDTGLDQLVTQPLADMPVKTCRYGLLLKESAGVLDDLIVYRLAEDRWMIVVNGATTPKDAAHFLAHLKKPESFTDRSGELAKLDVQGPEARKVLGSLVEDLQKLDYYTFDDFELLGSQVLISRTGYTGELGFEIYYPAEKVGSLWDTLLEKGAAPAGLGVRDILRIEMGYCLYGHELSEDINPLEAGLSKFIDWNKDFLGREALSQWKESGPDRRLICVLSDSRRSPRAHHPVCTADGASIGEITSGSFSPHHQRGVGLGFVKGGTVRKDDTVLIGQGASAFSATVCGRPAYREGSLKT